MTENTVIHGKLLQEHMARLRMRTYVIISSSCINLKTLHMQLELIVLVCIVNLAIINMLL